MIQDGYLMLPDTIGKDVGVSWEFDQNLLTKDRKIINLDYNKDIYLQAYLIKNNEETMKEFIVILK